jgi:hypothetical protein
MVLTDGAGVVMVTVMAILCFFGRHKPSVNSISRGKRGGYAALCESCGCPLEQHDKGPWRASVPLADRQGAT